jgi:hypothetical protein
MDVDNRCQGVGIHTRERLWLPKKKEEARIRYTPEYVPERRRELANRGLLQHLGNGVSVITEDGERYLNGEFDTGEFVDDSQ